MPLSTYENIIPQRGEIVKRLAAVFKKYFGDFFCLGGGTFLRFAHLLPLGRALCACVRDVRSRVIRIVII